MNGIRNGTAADAAALLELWAAAGAEPGVSDDVESVERLVRHDPTALIVAERDGRIVGSLIAAYDGWRAGFYRLAVHPAERRHGIAAALVDEGERRLRALGARRVQAIVVDDRDAAVGFWTSAGYRRQDGVGRYTRDLHLTREESSMQTPEC